jgi:hypothetical protein
MISQNCRQSAVRSAVSRPPQNGALLRKVPESNTREQTKADAKRTEHKGRYENEDEGVAGRASRVTGARQARARAHDVTRSTVDKTSPQAMLDVALARMRLHTTIKAQTQNVSHDAIFENGDVQR